jgi:hypothetical protein
VQGFGERGLGADAGSWSNRAGPVLRWNPSQHLQLQAAYLWGKVYGGKADLFSAQVLVSF